MNTIEPDFNDLDDIDVFENISFDSKKLLEGIESDPYITVGEARRMSRLTIEKSQFPAFRKALSAAEQYCAVSDENYDEDYKDTDESESDEIADTDNSERELSAEDIAIFHTKPSKSGKASKKSKQEKNEETPVSELDLFGIIDDIESNHLSDEAPVPDTPAFTTPAPIQYDPYNSTINGYDIDEITADIPTFDIKNSYKLEKHN